MPRSPILVLHYNELWLKGCNRAFFVRKLREAVGRKIEDLPVQVDADPRSRLVVRAESDEAARRAAARLQKTPGVQYIGVGFRAEPTLDAILETGSELMAERSFGSFRVTARRAVKRLPFRSMEVAQKLGARIHADAREAGKSVRVDLQNPEAVCFVEATADDAFIYSDKLPAVGGLPSNTAGRLMCLLSGGIDSAVAAYKILKRGVRVSFVHFYAEPENPGEDSPPIAREVVRILTEYQGASRLYLVPFGDIQREIVASVPDEFRLLLYRRMMLRISEKLAGWTRCHGIITGDSIAQVASQTIQNLEAVGSVAKMPLYRPLCGDDKLDIVTIAREIGTLGVSTEPFSDCCPRFMPRNPRIFSRVDELDTAEARLDIDRMVNAGVYGATREIYEYHRGAVRLKSVKDHANMGGPRKPEEAHEALAV